MATTHVTLSSTHALGDIAIRAALVGLTLATAWIHASLGGLLFTLNALGYATFAVLLILPGPIGRVRWLVRLGLLGFTLATIAGWVLFGPRFGLAYLDKAIEVAIVALLGVELWFVDGGPVGIVQRTRELVRSVVPSGAPG